MKLAMCSFVLTLLICGLALPVIAQQSQAPQQAAAPPVLLRDPLPRAEVEKYLKDLEVLNVKLKEQKLLPKLEDAFGIQPSYTLQQVFSIVAIAVEQATKKPEVPAAALIPRETVRQYFKVLEALDSKREGQDLFGKLQEAFKVQDTYAATQVLFISDPKAFYQKEEFDAAKRGAEPPLLPGAFSRDEVSNYFAVLAELDKAQKEPPIDRMITITNRYGDHPTYLASEIREVEKNPDPKKTKVTIETLTDAGRDLEKEQRKNADRSPFWKGLSGFKIRKDWSDVVAGEDLSQTGKKSFDDLEGAKFSYSHDNQAKPFKGSTVADTWSAVGALIYPFTWRTDELGKWAPVTTMLVPSVSINKVSTKDPANEVDHLDYRLGVVATWVPFDWGLSEVQVRGAFVYATDTGHHASLPAGELDIEPKFLWKQPRPRGRQWGGIGYRNILIEREPRKEDKSDDSLLDWQVQTWVHIEGGHLQRNGAKWETVDGSFFRIGPVVQGVINFPLFFRGFSINAEYSYLEPLSGPKDHKHYWKAGGSLTLYYNPALKHRISLFADYQEGGLTLSKQLVDIVTVGLGVTF